MNKVIALRMDDIGASSKKFEVYSKKWKGLGNVLFLKHLPYFKAWAKYPEMTAPQIEKMLEVLQKYNAKLTVGVTASWVNYDGSLEAYPEKYHDAAMALRDGLQDGLIEVANHGLTHCVLKNKAFRPKWFSSNRNYHREFWDWVDREDHFEHLKKSQDILQGFFKEPITTLIPPGNVFCDATLDAAEKYGIKLLNCQTSDRKYNKIRVLSNENVCAFHDKELVELGIVWLENTIKKHADKKFVFVKELA